MRKKYIIGFISIILALILPLGFFLCLALPNSDTYSETFVAELDNKYERLCSIEEPKIIVLGGSSVAFGLDSEALEEAMEMPVVNFGLYATLGTKLMLDLSRANINEGDIVVISPEMDAQTLSLYFNAEATWQATDENPSMLKHIKRDNIPDMAGAFYKHFSTKHRYGVEGVTLFPTGVYRSDSFNEYGDICHDRPYNVLYENTGFAYDTTSTINLTPEIVSDEFIEYVNEYTDWCNKRGASVYFSFCPMNKEALAEDCDNEAMIEFFSYMAENLSCPIINSPIDTVYPAEYFYDTNFHLNDAGVSLHTLGIATALYRAEEKTSIPQMEVLEMPALPIYEGNLSTDGNDFSHLFKYEEYGNGYKVADVTYEALTMTELEIPSSYNSKPVIALGENLFAGCALLERVSIYKSITVFEDGIFDGAQNLKEIHLYVDDAKYMSDEDAPLPVVNEGLMRDASPEAHIYLSQAAFERYLGDYSWQQHGKYFKVREEN